MEKSNRKLTWVHVTYEANGEIRINFATERWNDGRYLGKHIRTFVLNRHSWVRMRRLVRVMSFSTSVKYTIFAWNGYSICFEWKYS